MRNRLFILPLLILLLFTAACGALSEPEEATGPIEAIPLENGAADSANDSTTNDTTDNAAGSAETEEKEEVAEVVEPPPTDEAPVAEETETPVENETAGGLTIFTINPADSQVRFELDEDLAGIRTTVIGSTDQVGGEVGIDFAAPGNSQLGIIQVNARTFATDNEFRNRAIQNRILNTDAFEFITFTTTNIAGLPDSVAAGDTIVITVDGDLTIQDVTSPVTFNVELTLLSETELSGSASTTVLRETYGLEIPSVPNVANVEEEVELYIDFLATAG
jgi:polyisoprenoid-binding protein YceI